MWAIAIKEFLQLRRDRRTVVMMLLLPLVFLVVFGYAASFDVKEVRTLVVGPTAAAVGAMLPDQLQVVESAPRQGEQYAVDQIRDGRVTAAVVTSRTVGERPRLLIDGTNFFAAQATRGLVATAAGAGVPAAALPRVEVLFNPDLSTAPIMIPGLVGVVLVIAGTIATALGVVRERQAGTLEQLAVMPFRAGDVFLGKVAPYLLLACVELVVVTLAGIFIFDVPFRGSVVAYGLGALLFLFVTLGIGVLISTVSQTQGQAIQLAMVVMVPQILLSGFIFPLNAIVPAVRWISYVLPLTYFVPISRGVWVRGATMGSLWENYLVLAGFALVAFTVSVVRFRRDLAAGPPRAGIRRRHAAAPAGPTGQGSA